MSQQNHKEKKQLRAGSESAAMPAETLVALNVRVPVEIRRQLKVYAALNGLTMSELLISAFHCSGILSGSTEPPPIVRRTSPRWRPAALGRSLQNGAGAAQPEEHIEQRYASAQDLRSR